MPFRSLDPQSNGNRDIGQNLDSKSIQYLEPSIQMNLITGHSIVWHSDALEFSVVRYSDNLQKVLSHLSASGENAVHLLFSHCLRQVIDDQLGTIFPIDNNLKKVKTISYLQ